MGATADTRLPVPGRHADASSTPVRPDVERVAQLLHEFPRVMHAANEREWTGLRLTMSQHKVLFLLHHHGPLRAGDLAQRLDVGLSTITRLVDGLVDQGLVRREGDPADRRLVITRLTEQGTSLVERLHQFHQGRILALLEQMPAGDVACLARGLESLLAVARQVSR